MRREAKPDFSGTMLALVPDETPPFKNESGSHFHVTLGIYGPSEQVNHEHLMGEVAWLAKHQDPLHGEFSGYGTFKQDDGDVLYASLDVPGLNAFQEWFTTELMYEGFYNQSSHAFVPHMTLKYGFEGKLPSWPEDVPTVVSFSHIYVCFDETWIPYKLGEGLDGSPTTALYHE
ncbi:2'-5' RNA ligase family protein [Streptomyces sp. CoH17]|uniref:2'-5' RNA ligase family protein n=1 Tax=Streptomyces sp. CoH17 TaxID=2992806 RepID=UPI0022710276|nr:2'-5' RNA ligase family protein [Streptomyces sp. CoH17]